LIGKRKAETTMEVGLSLGSCLGDRLAHLRNARSAIEALHDVTIVATSPIYETEPVGVKPEYANLPYLNAVLIVETPIEVEALRLLLAKIEEAGGRIRTEDKFAPRTLDIDILYAGELALQSATLLLPHPRWAHRLFVVQPLADVRPDLILPGSEQTVAERLREIPLTPPIRLFTDAW